MIYVQTPKPMVDAWSNLEIGTQFFVEIDDHFPAMPGAIWFWPLPMEAQRCFLIHNIFLPS
jgi:hypothetical protein